MNSIGDAWAYSSAKAIKYLELCKVKQNQISYDETHMTGNTLYAETKRVMEETPVPLKEGNRKARRVKASQKRKLMKQFAKIKHVVK